jgi:uncharacterized protein (TIGR02757 family)
MENSSDIELESLKLFLDEQAEKFEQAEFLINDPLGIVKRFCIQQDQEIIGFLAATIAWGNRKSIVASAERILAIMEHKPYEFLLNTDEKHWQHFNFVHRTFNTDDLRFFFKALKNCYSEFGSLQDLFQPHPNIQGVKGRIVHFRAVFCATEHLARSEKHISNPMNGSSSKRLNMFLRWMTRPANKGVDLGIWDKIPLSELRIPLDVHTARVARKLGILTRKQNDWQALEEIHCTLDKLDPADPAKYDFALFGLGVSGF